jgi:hypothetical protein
MSGCSVWTPNKVIKVGTVHDGHRMSSALRSSGRQIRMWYSILSHIQYSQTVRDIGLVFVSNEKLGLSQLAVTVECTHAAGRDRGLELCEAEDLLYLALQYGDQPYGEKLYAAMNPLVPPRWIPALLGIANTRYGAYVAACPGRPPDTFAKQDTWVFRCPQ